MRRVGDISSLRLAGRRSTAAYSLNCLISQQVGLSSVEGFRQCVSLNQPSQGRYLFFDVILLESTR